MATATVTVIEGTYCPLCGRMGLVKGTLGGEAVAYCPTDAKGPKDAHTCYVLAGTRFATTTAAAKPKKTTTVSAEKADEKEDDN